MLGQRLSLKQNIQKQGSPVFNYTNGAEISTSVAWLKALDDTNSVTPFLPFTQVRVVNSSTVDVVFYKNQNSTSYRLVKANSQEILTDEPITSWYVLTVSGTADAGNIRVEGQTLPTTEDAQIRQEIGNPLTSLQKFIPFLSLLGK